MSFLARRAAILVALAAVSSGVSAWGPEGHAATGILALEIVDARAQTALQQILGATTPERLDELCNWPDFVRDQPEWDWAAPQHYVNIPRSATSYDAPRDCPEGRCVTEAIKKYAQALTDERLSTDRRQQAFAWLCHLVSDLHQPLHCGFADDRGGNSVEVIFNGETMNLHQFWDRQLILHVAGSREGLLDALRSIVPLPAASDWSPADVNAWTAESHYLAGIVAYPEAASIDEHFARASWELIRGRLQLAAQRLAGILNATLGAGQVRLEDSRQASPGGS
jgi:hypothetical protein